MFRNLFIAIFIIIIFTACSYSNNLPDYLANWRLVEKKDFSGQKLYDHINGGAEIYFEYGFVRLKVGYYQKGEKEIIVEQYQMTDQLSAYGIHALSRDITVPKLPAPYSGRIYDFYMDCANGNYYVKIINYDIISKDERIKILKDLIPSPVAISGLKDIFEMLPEKRLLGSEIPFRGSLALKNFCIIGQDNSFDIGKTINAAGCLLAHETKKYRCVVLQGKSDILTKSLETFLSNMSKKDYHIKRQENLILVEDSLSGHHTLILRKTNRLEFLFNISIKFVDELVKEFF